MTLKTSLLPHQTEAVNKLSKIKIAGIYMEQGTGKTRAALELISMRLSAGKVNHVLWLCPCSIKGSIKADIDKHSSDLPITIAGIESLSSSIKLNSELYEMCKNNSVYLIVDESNLVKNHKALRTKNITRLAEMCKYKMILNGTPISRCENDLFAQWYLLDWRILGYKSFWSFAHNHLEYDEYGKIRRCLNTDYLARKIAPYTYQVKKEDCLQLPRKNYKDCMFNLTENQYRHYEDVKNEFLMQVDEYDETTLYRLFTALQHVVSGRRIVSKYDKRIETKDYFKNYLNNPRMEKLIEVVSDEIIDEKVIIWCKYTDEIKMIADHYKKEFGNDAVVEFYGEVSKKKREEAIKKFENEAQFFIGNKTCAGYGLNLQFCRNAIYYTNDWDYATRIQSEDRIHRIGQNKNVYIYDIYSSGTIDERIIDCLYKKEKLVDSFKYYISKMKDKKYLNEWLNGRKNK